jgi:VWFA-related protein
VLPVLSSRLLTKFLVNRRKFLVAACAAGAMAQEGPTFSAGVKVVNVFVTVRDKNGQIVRDLRKEDFAVRENGKPQSIRYFSRESDLPLTVALLVDTSLSQGRVLENERGASYRFLDQVLREVKDQAVIVQFDQAIVIRQGLTSSHKDLEDTLSLLDTPTEQQSAYGSGTLLYDAVRTTCVQIMRKQTGRKALIVLTDGVDEGSSISLADAVRSAQSTGALVYCILFSDASYYGGRLLGSDGKRVLQRLAGETGGAFFEVTRTKSVGDIFRTIEEELRSEYSIGFVSNQPVTSSGFRQLKVTAIKKGFAVQSPDRYYAET